MEPLFYILSPLALILVFVLNRLVDVPADVRRNDQRVRARNEDLASWIEDDDEALKEYLRRHRPSGVVGLRLPRPDGADSARGKGQALAPLPRPAPRGGARAGTDI